jgi:hypothetical protein
MPTARPTLACAPLTFPPTNQRHRPLEGENLLPVTWVIIEEVKSGDWGMAGNPLSTNDAKALADGEPNVLGQPSQAVV